MTVTIAVLTGRRPDLLTRTLDSFATHHRELWDTAVRTVLHNTGDAETVQVLDRFRWDDRQTTDELLPIGAASQLLGLQVADADTEYVLRLEDDWEASPVPFYHDAVALLELAGQVRLRRADERVMDRCAVCRKPFRWRQVGGGHSISNHGHYTHNPSLMSTDVFATLFPYTNEKEAGKRFHGRSIVQHTPGVFAHLGGDGRSLKKNGGQR